MNLKEFFEKRPGPYSKTITLGYDEDGPYDVRDSSGNYPLGVCAMMTKEAADVVVSLLNMTWRMMGEGVGVSVTHGPMNRYVFTAQDCLDRNMGNTSYNDPAQAVHAAQLEAICCCGSPLDGSHDHNTCGPPIPGDQQ